MLLEPSLSLYHSPLITFQLTNLDNTSALIICALLAYIVYLTSKPPVKPRTREVPVAIPCTYCSQWELASAGIKDLNKNWGTAAPDGSGTPAGWYKPQKEQEIPVVNWIETDPEFNWTPTEEEANEQWPL